MHREFLFRTERLLLFPIKAGMLVLGIVTLFAGQAMPAAGVAIGFMLYGGVGVLLAGLLFPFSSGITLRGMRWLVFASLSADVLFTCFLIYHDSGPSGELYLLFYFLAIRAAVYYVSIHSILVLPHLFVPLYALTLYLQTHNPYLLLERTFLLRYVLLIAVVLAATYAAWLVDTRQQRIQRLSSLLVQKSQDLEMKTITLQRNAAALREHVVELRLLQEGLKAINSAESLGDLLHLIVTNTSEVLEGARCSIGLVDNTQEKVTIDAASGGSWRMDGNEFMVEQQAAAVVVSHGNPILIADLDTDGRFRSSSNIPVRAVVCVPLIAGGGILGALCATSAEAYVFAEDDVLLLSAFADQAAIAVRNARLYERLGTEKAETERTLRQLVAVHEVAGALVSTLNLEKTLNLIIERLVSLAGSSHCVIALSDDQEGNYLAGRIVRGATGDQRKTFRIDLRQELASARAIRLRRPIVVEDALHSPVTAQRRLAELWETRTYLVTPLISREQVIGAIYLGDARDDFHFGEREIALTNSFAHFAATAIANARLYEDLQKKRNELEAVVKGISDGVIVTDLYLNLLMINPIALRMFQLDEAPAGTPLPQIIRQDDLIDAVRATAQGDEHPVIREIGVGREHTEGRRSYQVLAAPLFGESELPQGVVTVLHDITAQKELERMKSNFLSVISHELKTPLHSIKGFVDIILMGKTGEINDLQRDFLETVRDQTAQLQRLISDLLDFSRMESGEILLHPEPVSIYALAQRIVGNLTPLAREGQIQLLNVLPETLLPVEADPVRLEQVLSNLVDNALKFTPAGGIVTLSGKDCDDHVQVSVHDTGIGIPLSEQARIFDRFYQTDASASRSYSGTGLGLTICKHIIEQHGGRIWIESDGRKGSTFIFTLPKQLPRHEELSLDFTTL